MLNGGRNPDGSDIFRPQHPATLPPIPYVAGYGSSSSSGDVWVNGHYRNGQWVSGHYRSRPDGNFFNNWTTYGNVNPYTGAIGTRRFP